MIQTTLTDLFGFDEEPQPAAEDPISVMRVLTANSCKDCRLGLGSPNNPGFIWKGNPEAHVAVVGDMPSAADMSARRAFADEIGNELNQWLRLARIADKDVFFTYLVQCKTPLKKESSEQRPAHSTEIGRCLPVRALRVLRSLPNLEIVWGLGLTVLKALLGGDPQIKSHQGFWFGTDLLPGKAIFGMPHPRDFDSETGESKRGRLKQCLLYWNNEYYGKTDRNGKILCPPRKIMSILALRERERREAKRTTGLVF